MSRSRIPFAAACAGVLLSGCLDHPAYQRPPLPVPQNWSAGQPAGAPLASNWWEEFKDPRLLQLLDQATANSPDLQIAADRVLLARDALKGARSHEYPSLSINALPPDPVYTQALAINNGRQLDLDTNLYAVSFDASYELDFWGRVSNSVKAAKSDYQASVFDAGTAAIGLRSEIARAYFDVRELDEEIALSAQRSALASERLRLARLRQAAGRIGAAPVMEAELAERDAQAQAAALQTSRSETVNALAVLIGVTPESLDIAPAPLRTTVTAPTPPQGLPSTMLERRPDIRAAEAHLIAAHAEIEVARAEMFPQVTLTAKYGFVAESVHALVFKSSSIAGAGPIISYSMFDGGRLSAQSDASKRKYDLLLAEYRKSIYAGFADVEKSLLGYQAASVDEARWAGARDLQGAQLQRLNQSLTAGRLSRFELIAAQQQALDVELAAARSYRDRLDSMVALYQALGGGWDPAALTLPADAPDEKPGDAPATVPAAPDNAVPPTTP